MTKEAKKEEASKPKYHGMNIHQRLHAVMGEVDYVQKQKAKADGLKYSHVSHDAVTAVVRKPCVEWGVHYYPSELIHTADGNKTIVTAKIRFVNIDNPSDFVETPSFGYGIDNQDKGPGKAISYAVKYALLKSFGLETGDDPENDNIDHKKEEKKPDLGMAYDAEQNQQAYDYALGKITGCTDISGIDAFIQKNNNRLSKLPKDKYEDILHAAVERKTDINNSLNGGAHV